MNRFAVALLTLSLLILTGCGTTKDIVDGNAIQKTVYTSDISVDDCYLCGNGIESIELSCWGQNNIGLISLNTFEIKPIEINRYDQLDGHLIEEYAGFIRFGGGGSIDGGFSANLIQEYDRGYASGSITFGEDKNLDIEKVGSFLCTECLNEILPYDPSRCFGIGAIHLDTKEIRIFEKNFGSIALGDFHVDCGLKGYTGDSDQMGILIFYCPVRYEKSPE